MTRATPRGRDADPVALHVVVEAEGWQDLAPEALTERSFAAVACELGAASLRGEVCVLLTDDEQVRRLNAAWRAKDKPTNVLSFPAEAIPGLPEEAQPLGDIALALETCTREAGEKGVPVENHMSHLIVHGLLHLLGYDHVEEEDAGVMEDLERRILERLGIGDPYAEPPGP